MLKPIIPLVACVIALSFLSSSKAAEPAPFQLAVQQITSGDKHHIFGYIGQCRTIPWNASGRYILGLELDFIDRMPKPADAATVFIIDTQNDNEIIRLDRTHAWNLQQGTMFYWNPNNAEHQFFFNDRDVRIDPAPRWNRTNDKILTPGLDKNNRRQMFLIEIK